MTAADRTAVVMSIRGNYADAIMDGTKIWEFRRKPLPGQVRTVIVNRTGPQSVRGIVGTFTVANQCKSNVARLVMGLDASTHGWGITAGSLEDYAGSRTAPIWAIAVDEVWCCRPLPLSVLGIGTAPQSWRYAPAGWEAMLREEAVTR